MVIKKKKKIIQKKKTVKKFAKKRPLKKSAVKPVKKSTKPKKSLKSKKQEKNVIGFITHYFPQVQAAVVKLKAPLAVGDAIKIKGHTTDFAQVVESIQMDRVPIKSAKKGQEIGIMVKSRVRRHDIVSKG